MGYLFGGARDVRMGGPGGCRADLAGGRGLFRRFHRFPAPETVRERFGRLVPEVLVHLGRLKAVIYTSDKWDRGRPKTYIHFMETPPRLACDPAGRQLYIVGGSYRVTSRGIEG